MPYASSLPPSHVELSRLRNTCSITRFFVVFPLVTHETHTDEVAIGELPLNERQSMQFQYDFGANWRFDVQLETIESEGTKISEPTIVESRGEAPAEYKSENEW